MMIRNKRGLISSLVALLVIQKAREHNQCIEVVEVVKSIKNNEWNLYLFITFHVAEYKEKSHTQLTESKALTKSNQSTNLRLDSG